MLDRTDDISIAAENWLAQFEIALAECDDGLLKTLFHPESYWRDVLALSWNLYTINGAIALVSELKTHARRDAADAFQIYPDGAAARRVSSAAGNLVGA